MSGNDRTHIHEVHRLGPDGARHPVTQADLGRYDYIYDVRGSENWETAERYLVDQYEAGGWEPGRYRVMVTRRSGGTTSAVCTVERLLPLHPAYSVLPYHPGRRAGRPARAYVHHLLDVYTDATLELVAEHLGDFDQHYKAVISTEELTTRTGYQIPGDRPRPLSPYSRYQHAAELPDHLK